ncbi:general stress protein [Virgibacillus ainsalahensis]
MTKEIKGAYRTEEEAVEAANDLRIQGYREGEITIVTNSRKSKKIKHETDVPVEKGISQKQDGESFMDKVDRLFADETTNPLDQLMELGINKEEAQLHQGNMKSGFYLILTEVK